MRTLLPALGILAGSCLMLGSVLDWSGVAYSSTVDRRLVFAAGVATVALGVAAFLWRQRVLVLALVPAVVGLNMGVVNFRDIDGKLYEFAGQQEASVGVGIYLVFVGGVLALAVGICSALLRQWLGRMESRPLDF